MSICDRENDQLASVNLAGHSDTDFGLYNWPLNCPAATKAPSIYVIQTIFDFFIPKKPQSTIKIAKTTISESGWMCGLFWSVPADTFGLVFNWFRVISQLKIVVFYIYFMKQIWFHHLFIIWEIFFHYFK